MLLHNQDERLAELISGAGYRIPRTDKEVQDLSQHELKTLFRPPVVNIIEELKIKGSIEALDELIQLTPAGLFDMMRIKGLGGKKLNVLWTIAKINNIEDLLKACKNNDLSSIPGFGVKTQQNN